jgi:hypothetical protein
MNIDINILSGNIGYSVVQLLGLGGLLGPAGTMVGKVIGDMIAYGPEKTEKTTKTT